MFSYVDPNIKKLLVEAGKLLSINERGERCSDDARDEPFINLVGPVPLPLHVGHESVTFDWFAWVRHSDLSRIDEVVGEVRRDGPKMLFGLLSSHMSVNSALVLGDFAKARSPLVRVHSNCLTGDVFGSLRCDCGPQLQEALGRIAAEGVGALIYMAGHEGRGIGLWAKAITYLLQDAGHDTYEANEKLGLPVDSRDFSDAGRVLRFLRDSTRSIRLLGNNPLKREGLEAMGIDVESQEPLVVGVSRYNVRYLSSKRDHGHMIPEDSVKAPDEEPPRAGQRRGA
jgi:GTP cyclohydrolase II